MSNVLPARASVWISHGLESLCAEQSQHGDPPFDVLIVGSGYGGAVAADRLSARTRADGAPLRIAVLERGREYLRGAFPDTLADLAGHVRFAAEGAGRARGRLEGLFDLRLGTDMSVLVANGVGGGSLINAGVMLFPRRDEHPFDQAPWPAQIDFDDLQARADRLKVELGARFGERDNTLAAGDLPRQSALSRIARHEPVPLTIALEDGLQSVAGVKLERCIRCGDCATGCNHGAKISLDLSLLRRAQSRGVRIVSGATVSKLRRADAGDGWTLEVWHTDLALRRRMAGPLALHARRVVLAAGTLGSTELLLRSQDEALRFSQVLGQRFSGNGDLVAALHAASVPMNAVADESMQPSKRGVGPTISGMLDWRQGGKAEARCLVQDLAVPGALRRVFEEVTTTSSLLHRLGQADHDHHHPDDTGIDPCAVDPDQVARGTVVALIARDSAGGVMSAVPPAKPDGMEAGLWLDPGLRIHWPEARADPRIEACHDRLEHALGQSGIGARLLPNPAWRLLPKDLETLLDAARGPLATVHPLGGCAMGSSRFDGVVDHLGRVFDGADGGAADAVHDGLLVLDGSIVPTSLGVNPALTIAALADRAIELLCAGAAAKPGAAVPQSAPAAPAEERPRFVLDTDKPRRRRRTRLEIVERLSGVVQLQGRRCFVELSLLYRSTRASAEGATLRGKCLRVQPHPQLSRLRVFADATPPRRQDPHDLTPKEERLRRRLTQEREDNDALLIAPVVDGSLRLLHREASGHCLRTGRALWAWAANRGVRDIWQELLERLAGRGSGPLQPGKRVQQLVALASRAGQVRRFDYQLELGRPTKIAAKDAEIFAGWKNRGGPHGQALLLAGHKRLTYERRSSPIAQLMQLTLTEFGGLRIGQPDRIEVSPSYFAQMQLPLLRVVQQPHLPGAYADLASFGLYLLRVLLETHLWTLRKPDAPTARAPQRLPGPLPGLPPPRVHEVDPGDHKGALCRLTVYPRRGGSRGGRPPVLMIHGYSASGTTFAHPALPSSLAAHLWQRGAEPWVLDLRSSCGLSGATQPWAFEDMAGHDIPAAVETVCNQTGHERIDIVSHCMGSAMLAMALLGEDALAARVRPRLRRWVMSQVTPAIVFSPANLLRAYLLQYALNLLPGLRYPIGGAEGPAGVGAFDRLLAALPYPGEGRDSEFDIENPPPWRFWQRTPWVRTRHRLDALFGRVFDSRQLSPQTREHIDDFFGELSLATVSQTIRFARNAFVADRNGIAALYQRDARLQRLQDLPILGLHARDSGLADWETGLCFAEYAAKGGFRHYRALVVEGCGHQDLLIGTNARAVFDHVDQFLDA